MNRLSRYISIFITIALLVVGCQNAMATTTATFFDDYEKHKVGDALGYASRASNCAADGDNQVVAIGVPSSGQDNGRYLVQTTSDPGEKILISLDFKLPGNVSDYSTKLLESYYKDGKGSVADVMLKNGAIYTAKGGTTIESLRTDIKSNKWYNIFVVIDKNSKTWKLYTGSNESAETDFTYENPAVEEDEIEKYSSILWPVSIRNYNRNALLYIDNCEVTGLVHEDLDVAVYTAKSIMLEAELGYENGQYPHSAMSMLEDTYNKISPYAKDTTITPEEATAYADELKAAITLFESSKIDTTGSGGSAAYIVSQVPDIIVVDSEQNYTGVLDAKVYDSAKNELTETIEWSLDKEYSGVSITNGQLIASAGTEATVVLKASCGNLYLKQSVKLTIGKKVTEIKLTGENGEITITGSMNRKPDLPVTLSVVGDGINITGEVIEVAEDKSFTWTGAVGADTPFQKVTISITGDDMNGTLSWIKPYYGVNWESGVLTEVNSAPDSETLGQMLLLYDEGLKIDKELYSKNSQVYKTRIFAKLPYADLPAVTDACKEVEYVVNHSNATRNEIEEILSSSMTLLSQNGFDVTAFNGLSEKNGFYVDASLLEIDIYTDTLITISGKLNDIIKNILEPEIETETEDTNVNIGTVAGTGGGGGGGGGGNRLNDYKIDLIEKEETDVEVKNETAENKIEQFKDASDAPWANEALLFMRQAGIMEGDGINVRPNDTVTRGEFSKILVTAFELSAGNIEQSFIDTEGKWWKEYAVIATQYGIMNGMGDGSFGGDGVITREMLAVTIDRAIITKKIELYDQKEENEFQDNEEASDYAKEAIERLALKGIVSGIGNNLFAPKLTVSRAEAAQIVYNVLKQL